MHFENPHEMQVFKALCVEKRATPSRGPSLVLPPLPSTAMPTVEQFHTSLGYRRVQNIPHKSAKINTFKAFKCSSYFKNSLNDSKTFTKKSKSNTVQKMHLGKPAHLYFRFWCFKHHRNHSFNAAQIKMNDFERLKDFECLHQGS